MIKKKPSKLHGFLLAIELEDEAPNDPESLRLRLANACNWMDGVGTIDCDYLGVIEVEEEPNGNN